MDQDTNNFVNHDRKHIIRLGEINMTHSKNYESNKIDANNKK